MNENHINKLLELLFEDVSERVRNPREYTGFSTGFPKLNIETEGIVDGNYWVIGADARIGKSTFAMNLMLNASRSGASVVYFNLEMSKIRVIRRIVSICSGVETKKLKKGNLTEEELKKVMDTINHLHSANLKIWITEENVFCDEIIRECLELKEKIGKVDLVIVDYIQRLRDVYVGPEPANSISACSSKLKDLSQTLPATVIALSQVSKESQKKKETESWGLKGSSSLLQDADVVLLLNRDWLAEGEEKKYIYATLDKVRDGETGKFMIYYDLGTGIMSEMEAPPTPPPQKRDWRSKYRRDLED